MKHMLKAVVLLVLVAVIAAPAVAQEKEKRKRKRNPQPRGPVMMLKTKLEKIDLTDDQKEKIKAIVTKYEPKLKKLAETFKPAPGQREAMIAARKKAMEEGKKGKELREAVEAAMNLTDEQKEARKEQQKLMRELNKEVLAVLTPEQKSALRPAGKERGKQGDAKKRRGRKRKADK